MIKRPHYAWLVCLGGGLALFSTMGLGVNVFSLYQPEIIQLNAFTNAQGSWITTTRSLFILLALLTVNQLCTRLGLRPVMALGVALVGLSHLFFGLSETFFQYCCAAALTGVGYCYGGMVPLALVITAWFRDRRGLALGLAAGGSGVSTIFAPAIITRLIQGQGMRAAFLWEGAFLLLVAFATWLLLRNHPGELGLSPYEIHRAEGNTASQSAPPPSFRGVGRTERWLVLLAALLVGGPGGPGFSHLTVLYTSAGYDSGLVAALVSYMGVVILGGKIFCGQVYDRLGGRRGNHYVFGVFLAGQHLCCLAPVGGLALPFLAMTAFSLGLAITAVSPSAWASDLFAPEQYGETVRSITVAYTLGTLVFGPIPGILADGTGSYVPSYALFALFLALSLGIFQVIYRRAGR